jgi:hypothetical protein
MKRHVGISIIGLALLCAAAYFTVDYRGGQFLEKIKYSSNYPDANHDSYAPKDVRILWDLRVKYLFRFPPAGSPDPQSDSYRGVDLDDRGEMLRADRWLFLFPISVAIFIGLLVHFINRRLSHDDRKRNQDKTHC